MKPYYQDDFATIFHGDCRELLPELKADVVITDPPYNAKKKYGLGTNDNRPWDEWVRWFVDCRDLCLGAAPDALFFLSQRAHAEVIGRDRRPDWTLVWSKPLSLAICALPFMPHWEPIAYYGKTRRKDGAFWGGDVLRHNVTKNIYGHPAEKPIRLMVDLVSRFTGVVLDPFAGSGTTLVAAKALGRKSIGIEIEEKYCEIAANRLRQEVLWKEPECSKTP